MDFIGGTHAEALLTKDDVNVGCSPALAERMCGVLGISFVLSIAPLFPSGTSSAFTISVSGMLS